MKLAKSSVVLTYSDGSTATWEFENGADNLIDFEVGNALYDLLGSDNEISSQNFLAE